MTFNEYLEQMNPIAPSREMIFKFIPGLFMGSLQKYASYVYSLGDNQDTIIKIPPYVVSSDGYLSSVTKIPRDVFQNHTEVTDIILPYTLGYIEPKTFSGCSGLRSITIPKLIKTIPCDAFEGCDQLTDVYYAGTLEEWKQIEFSYEKTEIDYGTQISGSPVDEITEERLVHLPGNFALFRATIHCRCDLKKLNNPIYRGYDLEPENCIKYKPYRLNLTDGMVAESICALMDRVSQHYKHRPTIFDVKNSCLDRIFYPKNESNTQETDDD